MNTPPVANVAPRTGRLMKEDDTVVNEAESLVLGVDAVSMMNWMFREVAKENIFTVNNVFANVADAATVYMRIKAPADKHVFLTASVSIFGKARVKSYAGTTFSANGTVVVPFNRHVGGRAADTLAWHTPTINVLGGIRLDQLIPSGTTGASRVAGTSEDSFGSIIPPGAEILLSATNQSGQATDIGMSFTFAEKFLPE